MQKAREVFTANLATWGQIAGKSKAEVKGLMAGDMAEDQAHVDRINLAIKGADKSIADNISKRHSTLVEHLGVSTTGTDPKPVTTAELEQFTRIGLLPDGKNSAMKADKVRTLMTKLLTKHSKQFWAILPIIYRMLYLNPNCDKWEVEVPDADAICAAVSEAALVETGVGPLVAAYYNQQNMDLLTVMVGGKGCSKLIEASQHELTYGDEGSIERTVRGKKDDFIAHLVQQGNITETAEHAPSFLCCSSL